MDKKRKTHERRKLERRWIGGQKPEIDRRTGERRLGERRKTGLNGIGPKSFLDQGKKPIG